jgi:4-oxalocrotonate tautomerase
VIKGNKVPHINMKHFPSLTDSQRDRLSDLFVEAIVNVVKCPRSAISVAFKPVAPEIWMTDVYEKEILGENAFIHTFPDYNATNETV